MKTLIVENPLREGWQRRAVAIPDSAMGRNRQPIFLPDNHYMLEGEILPAILISRLGKHITPKFANRYFDAFTVVHLLQPSDPKLRNALTYSSDYVLTPGDRMQIEDTSNFIPPTIKMECGRNISAIEFPDSEAIANAISLISENITLKNGDIIVFSGREGRKIVPEPDLKCRISIPETDLTILEFHYK